MGMDDSWIMESDEEYYTHDNKHDKGYKYLLSVKRIFVQLLRSFVKQGWVNKIDEANVEKIDKSFILKDFREKEADLVYKVRLDNKEVFFYILLELQSKVDFQMPYRLLQYMIEIWRTILSDTHKNIARRKGFRLPVIVPCILYNGKDNWTVCRSFRETLESNEMFEDYILDFKYILFDVKRYDEVMLLNLTNLIGSVFLVEQKSENEEISVWLKGLMKGINELSKEDQELFVSWAKNIVFRGMSIEKREELEKEIKSKEDSSMIYAFEEAIKREFSKSKKEGIEEGIEKGKIEVIIRASKRGLDLESISDLTNMDISEVKRIISENKN